MNKIDKINMHKGHSASCLCCEYLSAIDATPGYSDMTPGSPMALYCSKSHWDFDGFSVYELFDKMHDIGLKCEDFEVKD